MASTRRRKMVQKKKNIGAYRKASGLSTRLTSARDTARFGARLVLGPDRPRVWLLRGPLGAGKTTMVRGLLRQLGVRRPVASPTFGLAKAYQLRRGPWKHLLHVDAYRLRSRAEVPALELREWLSDPHALVVVEWPERLSGVRWGRHGVVRLRHAGRGRVVNLRLRAR